MKIECIKKKKKRIAPCTILYLIHAELGILNSGVSLWLIHDYPSRNAPKFTLEIKSYQWAKKSYKNKREQNFNS